MDKIKIEFDMLQDKSRDSDSYKHIHGYLNFKINGRSVPHMGYWGANDVCFNQWIRVFVGIRNAIQKNHSTYTFDEHEQGQPAFLFEIKPASQIAFSIIKSASGEGFNDPDWQEIMFSYADFKAAFLDFKDRFLAQIAELAPQQVAYWKSQFEVT